MSNLCGSIERIVFQNPQNSFTVARLIPTDRPKRSRRSLTTVTGQLPALRPGEVVELEGEWYDHPRHGTTFSVKQCTVTLPAECQAIAKYLASGWVRGLGQAKAAAIVDRFGEETFKVLTEEPERLSAVKGIGTSQAREIAEAWREQATTREIADFLRQGELDVALAPVIFNVYGAQAVDFIKQNPYRLEQDFDEVSFEEVERLAKKLGHPREGRDRLASAVRRTLAALSEDGHVFAFRDALIEKISSKLRVNAVAVAEAVEHLRHTRQVIVEPFAASSSLVSERDPRDAARQGGPLGDLEYPLDEVPQNQVSLAPEIGPNRHRVYLTAYFLMENWVARHLAAIMDTPGKALAEFDWTSFIASYEAEERIALDAQQRDAVKCAAESKVCIITGGPGVGKTMTLRVLARALSQIAGSYCLAAPTGRAAKRLAEVTGEAATTIHRLLGFQPGTGRFKFDDANPLPFDYVIIDEASMLDLPLVYQLLKAIPPEARLVLVGDADQLPSIGPGNVLADLIASERLPVARLTHLFRQAQGGQILHNAHRINRGRPPLLENKTDSDFFMIQMGSSEETATTIVSLVKDRLPRSFGLDRVSEIQVLSPIYAGTCGVTNLNQLLQAELNPRRPYAPELRVGGQALREGDKVMQVRNNYAKGVYNGDLGMIEQIDWHKERVVVNFGLNGPEHERTALRLVYETGELGEIVLAYAVSVHKAQGSEYPVVVMPALLEHQSVLQRSLLYTAITRAKRLCVLVGSTDALVFASSRNLVEERCTALAERLRSFAG